MRVHIVSLVMSFFAVILHPTMVTGLDLNYPIRVLKRWQHRNTFRDILVQIALFLPAGLVLIISIMES